MICKKGIKIVMGVGMVLCASASFAAVSENFESGSLDSKWTGDKDNFVKESLTPPSVGYPISGAHTQVLSVEGSVTCANSSTSDGSVSDFLVYIPECSDDLETDGLGNAKIAIAAGKELTTDSKIPLMLYCKNASGTEAGWNEITVVSAETWVRVTMVFKDGRCHVSVDGEPVKNDIFGYVTSDGTKLGGAWYNQVTAGAAVESLSFIGCARIDDVVIKDKFSESVFGNASVALDTKNETVSYDNLNKWNMTSAELLKKWNDEVGTTGMTYGQKILCGLDPTNETVKFEPEAITKTSKDEATITFPCDDTTKLGRYKIVIRGGTADGKTEVAGAQSEDSGHAKIQLTNLSQTDPVMTFKLVAEKK